MLYQVQCKSLLLQKALENFLDGYLDENGAIISDEKGDIIIGKDIKLPFTKSQLLIQLEAIEQRKIKEAPTKQTDLEIDMSIFSDLMQTQEESFDEKLDKLINKFAKDLKKLIKEEYAKK